jgi:hypothetical protein
VLLADGIGGTSDSGCEPGSAVYMRPPPGAEELGMFPVDEIDGLRPLRLAARSPGDLGVSTRLVSRSGGPESGSGGGDTRPGLFKIFGDSVGRGGSVVGAGLPLAGAKPPVLALCPLDELAGLSGCEGFRMFCISSTLEGPRAPGIAGCCCSGTGGGNIGANSTCAYSASPVDPWGALGPAASELGRLGARFHPCGLDGSVWRGELDEGSDAWGSCDM